MHYPGKTITVEVRENNNDKPLIGKYEVIARYTNDKSNAVFRIEKTSGRLWTLSSAGNLKGGGVGTWVEVSEAGEIPIENPSPLETR